MFEYRYDEETDEYCYGGRWYPSYGDAFKAWENDMADLEESREG